MIDLRLGDGVAGLAGLADGSVDVALLDPPFDERTHRAALETGKGKRGKRKIDGALPFAPLDDDALSEVAGNLARVVRRWIVVFCAERQIEAWATGLESGGARVIRIGQAVRVNPRPQTTGDRPGPGSDPIVIAHAGTGRMRWNGRGRPGVWMAGMARFDPGGQLHPTQKPLGLMRALVADFSDPGELVLDPFAGAGSTAVACREKGRRFLGWEIDRDYHAKAIARIAATREQLDIEDRIAKQMPLVIGAKDHAPTDV